MKKSPRRFSRGDTSTERPGLVFLRYGKTKKGDWREEWVTPEKLEEFKRVQYANAKKWNRSPSGRDSQRKSRKLQRDSGYAPQYMSTYRKVWVQRPENKLATNYRSRMRIALKHQGVKKNSKTEATLGCSFAFFRQWIEMQFKPGMDMANYGKVWVVDHIIPVAAFDLFNPEELKRCFHYTNCQPLFKEENHSKNDRIPGTEINGRDVSKVIPFTQRIA